MGGRRGAGEGSVYWVESRNCWAAALDVTGLDGRRRRKVVKAKTKAQVLAKLREAQKRAEGGLAPDDGLTTGAWLDFWLESVLPGSVAPASERSYREALRRIRPHIERVKLAKLGPQHVQAAMRAMEAAGLAPRSVAYSRAVLRRSLTHAVKWRKVPYNAAALTDAPRKPKSRIDDSLTVEEVERVLEAAKLVEEGRQWGAPKRPAAGRGEQRPETAPVMVPDRLEALAVVVLSLGLRQGEALELRWDDINLDEAWMDVHGTKSEASNRRVALPAFVVDALRRHRALQREDRLAATYWADPDLVFATTIGTPIHRRNVVRWWHYLTEVRAGVGRRRFHSSRHTAATVMLNAGVPLEVVSATLGHAGIGITSDVYAKVRPDYQRSAADAMQALLGR